MGLLSNLQWNVTKPRAGFSAELQAPLQPAAAPSDAVPLKTHLLEKKYPPGHTGKYLQGWELHKELTLQDAFSSWEIQELLFTSHSSQNGCERSACILILSFFFSSDQPKGAMGLAFASGAHTSTAVNNSHASVNPLAGIRRTHACERLPEKAKSVQRRTACLARSYKTGNKGHLALIRGIKLMSKAPETTFPSHLHWKRKRALLSKQTGTILSILMISRHFTKLPGRQEP